MVSFLYRFVISVLGLAPMSFAIFVTGANKCSSAQAIILQNTSIDISDNLIKILNISIGFFCRPLHLRYSLLSFESTDKYNPAHWKQPTHLKNRDWKRYSTILNPIAILPIICDAAFSRRIHRNGILGVLLRSYNNSVFLYHRNIKQSSHKYSRLQVLYHSNEIRRNPALYIKGATTGNN